MKKVEITTTFKDLHDNNACIDRYRHLAKALGGITKYGRTTPINLLVILEHNSLNDFFWTLGTVKDNKIFRLMGTDFAESVLPIFEKQYPDDPRIRDTIEVTRRYVRSEATIDELRVAASAAYSAYSAARAYSAASAAIAAYSAYSAASAADSADSADSAAYSAAYSAARAASADSAAIAAIATYSAYSAASAASAASADYRAASADYSAAIAAEKEKQIAIIKKYLK